MFDAPSTLSGDIAKPADLSGHLLIVVPKEYRENIPTKMGVSDAVSVDLADVDTGQVYRSALWFNVALISATKDKIGGQPILARMGQGVAKTGQTAPWVLEAANNDGAAVARATAWLGANPEFLGGGFAKPTPAAAPAAVTAGQIPNLDSLPPEVQALLQRKAAEAAAA